MTADHGAIYYASSRMFEAHCRCHDLERCTMTKKAGPGGAASISARAAAPAAVLGMLGAWLSLAEACGNKEGHKERDFLKRLAAEDEQGYRAAARLQIAEVPGGLELLQIEAGGADSALLGEPMRVPGF